MDRETEPNNVRVRTYITHVIHVIEKVRAAKDRFCRVATSEND